MADKVVFLDRMLSLGLARVSEAAAMASANLVGRGDEKAADQAAVNAMRDQLNLLDIHGTVVIGEGGDVLVGEVSTVNDDETDNIFREPIGRFAEVEEDEAPTHLLVSDYARWLGG